VDDFANVARLHDNQGGRLTSISGYRELARADIVDYIEVFNNRTRRHSHLGGVSPEAFERASI